MIFKKHFREDCHYLFGMTNLFVTAIKTTICITVLRQVFTFIIPNQKKLLCRFAPAITMLFHSLVIANFSEQIRCKDFLWQVTTLVIGMIYILKDRVRGLQINVEIS